ncbi:MAG: VanZ family protein [Bacteroidetes bacterium]|nr:VanZ family protein [Bacteroidota bacterium]
MKRNRLTIAEIILWIAVSITIIVLSLVSGSKLQVTAGMSDKILHLVAYIVLGFLSFAAVRSLNLPGSRNILFTGLWSFGYCSAMGGSLEILQQLTGRFPDIVDFAADAGGAFIGISFSWIALRLYQLFIKKQKED